MRRKLLLSAALLLLSAALLLLPDAVLSGAMNAPAPRWARNKQPTSALFDLPAAPARQTTDGQLRRTACVCECARNWWCAAHYR
jgi:hypothetical protein